MIQKGSTCAFIPFVVAGYPSFAKTEEFIDVLVQEGADAIEIGIPFTDAVADGPIIQTASHQVASRGRAFPQALELIRSVKRKYPKLGLVIFTYYNPVLKAGVKEFAKRARRAGAKAVLVVDLPPEEASDYRAAMREAEIGTIFLASPTTSVHRLPLIGEASTEFVYYVSRVGVTGTQNEISASLGTELRGVRNLISKPIAVGFGISKGEQAAQIAPFADAVVVGSAFIKLMDKEDAHERVRVLARDIKRAIQ